MTLAKPPLHRRRGVHIGAAAIVSALGGYLGHPAATMPACPVPVAAPVTSGAVLDVHFSPRGGCTDAVVAFIGRARASVHVLAYSFTSAPIADALIAAHRRGLDVEIVLDKGQPTAVGSQMQAVVAAGIPTWVDHVHAIAHNKTVVIDSGTPDAAFETGSFNFTASAEDSNGENALTVTGAQGTAALYEADFQRHRAHSLPAR